MKGQKGFTLVELLVVISIISLLSSVILTSIGTAKESATESNISSTLLQVRTALELYHSTNGKYPNEGINYSAGVGGWPNLGGNFVSFVTTYLVATNYLAQAPAGPGGKAETTNFYYFYFTRNNLNDPADIRKCGTQIANRYVLGIYAPNHNFTKIPKFTRYVGGSSTNSAGQGYYCITTN